MRLSGGNRITGAVLVNYVAVHCFGAACVHPLLSVKDFAVFSGQLKSARSKCVKCNFKAIGLTKKGRNLNFNVSGQN